MVEESREAEMTFWKKLSSLYSRMFGWLEITLELLDEGILKHPLKDQAKNMVDKAIEAAREMEFADETKSREEVDQDIERFENAVRRASWLGFRGQSQDEAIVYQLVEEKDYFGDEAFILRGKFENLQSQSQ